MPKISCHKQYRNKRLKKNDKMETDTNNLPTPTTTSQSQNDLATKSEPSVEKTLQGKDVLPQNSLDSYQNCLELIQPLKDYIHRIGNNQASLRLREVEKVIKYVIKNEKRPRKSCQ